MEYKMCGSNYSLLMGKLGVAAFLPNYTVLEVGFMSRILSTFRFWRWCFPCCPMCRSYSARFWISLRGNCSMCRCVFSESLGGGKFRSLLCHHLGPEVTSNILTRALVQMFRNRDSHMLLERCKLVNHFWRIIWQYIKVYNIFAI